MVKVVTDDTGDVLYTDEGDFTHLMLLGLVLIAAGAGWMHTRKRKR